MNVYRHRVNMREFAQKAIRERMRSRTKQGTPVRADQDTQVSTLGEKQHACQTLYTWISKIELDLIYYANFQAITAKQM